MSLKARKKITKTASNSASNMASHTVCKSMAQPLPQEALNGLAQVKWTSLQTDLRSALGAWNEFPTENKVKSPEEDQLDKVKNLIENLKQKLNDF